MNDDQFYGTQTLQLAGDLNAQGDIIWEEDVTDSRSGSQRQLSPGKQPPKSKHKYPQIGEAGASGREEDLPPATKVDSASQESVNSEQDPFGLVQSDVQVERAMAGLLEQQVRIVRQVIVVQLRRMLQALERIKQASRE